jgi:HPt (histidine-containing phosphotransfer) domain-containing protein
VQNRFMFVSGDEANEMAQRTKERLADPEQRAVLRAEQRAAVVSQNVGVRRLVGLDASMEQKLIELLTDQQMERLEQMYVQPRQLPDLQKYADEATQRMNALRDLLGDEKLERFQVFEMNQSARYWVGQFSARLAPADQLQPEQEDRLTALKQEQFQRASAAIGSFRTFRHSIGQPLLIEDMQRDSQRQALVANENSWRTREVEHRALEQKAAVFLTSTQLTELSRYQAQEQDNLRRFVEAARAEGGMDPKIPETPERVEETPKLIEALVQVEVRLTVNREPTTVTRTVRNGESFTFEAAQGLIVEATPMMYDADWIDVHLKYYEEGATGRRRLSGGSISTAQARPANGSLGTGGSGGTVITGRKGYAVESTVNAKVL